LGDLIEDLHQHSQELWKEDVARSMTTRAAMEKHLRAVEISVRATYGGVTWIICTFESKPSTKTRDYTYKAHKRAGSMYELDPVSVA
jgi:hypothetical protein